MTTFGPKEEDEAEDKEEAAVAAVPRCLKPGIQRPWEDAHVSVVQGAHKQRDEQGQQRDEQGQRRRQQGLAPASGAQSGRHCTGTQPVKVLQYAQQQAHQFVPVVQPNA